MEPKPTAADPGGAKNRQTPTGNEPSRSTRGTPSSTRLKVPSRTAEGRAPARQRHSLSRLTPGAASVSSGYRCQRQRSSRNSHCSSVLWRRQWRLAKALAARISHPPLPHFPPHVPAQITLGCRSVPEREVGDTYRSLDAGLRSDALRTALAMPSPRPTSNIVHQCSRPSPKGLLRRLHILTSSRCSTVRSAH